jgi:hypothetical protein
MCSPVSSLAVIAFGSAPVDPKQQQQQKQQQASSREPSGRGRQGRNTQHIAHITEVTHRRYARQPEGGSRKVETQGFWPDAVLPNMTANIVYKVSAAAGVAGGDNNAIPIVYLAKQVHFAGGIASKHSKQASTHYIPTLAANNGACPPPILPACPPLARCLPCLSSTFIRCTPLVKAARVRGVRPAGATSAGGVACDVLIIGWLLH